MSTISQRSFSGGEISPSLYSRTDFAKYQTSLRTCKNFIVQKHGGVANRPGTQFISETRDSSSSQDYTRLIPFISSTENSYVLEFSDGFFRIIKDGQLLLDGLGDINVVSTQIDGADLQSINYIQSADVMTIVFPNGKPREIRRYSDITWSCDIIDLKSDVPFPTEISTSAGSGTKNREYKVTAIRSEDYKESNAGTISGTSFNISSVTKANPAVVTMAASLGSNFNDGDEIYISGILSGMTELNNRRFFITSLGSNTFTLQGEDSTDYGTWAVSSPVANVKKTAHKINKDTISTSSPMTISWIGTGSNIQEYNVYRRDDLAGAFGLIGVAKGSSFVDVGGTPDTKKSPPIERGPFEGANNWPSVVSYFQQRLMFANTNNDKEKIFGSRIGDFKNFSVSSPLQDDDAVTFKISGRQVNEVRHLLDLGELVVLTTGGEFVASAGALTPTSINIKQQSYNGASKLSPILINDTALYVQERGSVVRDLVFNFQSDGYTGNDLSLFAFHFFEGYTIKSWAYQKTPHSVVWAVRDDGILLGLTYLKEQQILAWHQHNFGNGICEGVCSIPEGSEDIIYLTIRRNGKKYIERMSTRQVVNQIDLKFLDSHITIDGRNTTATTMTLTSGGGWTYEDDLTLTASAASFVSGDLENQIVMFDNSGAPLRLTIKEFTSSTVVIVQAHKTVPTELQGATSSNWNKAVKTIDGLDHLEGEYVSVFADSYVVASPNNPSYIPVQVSGGQIILEKPYCVIHIGLPYISDIETLNIDTNQGETISDKRMIVTSVSIQVEKSRGGWAGTKQPIDNINGLYEFKIRETESYEDTIDLKTGSMEVQVDGEYNENGRVFIRQVDPLPFTILAINPAGKFPFR